MKVRSALIEILYKSATSTKKIRSILTPFGAFIFATFIGIFILAGIYTDRLLHLLPVPDYPLNILIAILLFVPGLLATGWSVFHFVNKKGTPVPLNPPPQLVTDGPYRFVRNPMLCGIFFLMIGTGFFLQSLSLLLIFTPLFILVNVLELKKIEEPELEKRLGNAYREYRQRTPMFFPGRIKA